MTIPEILPLAQKVYDRSCAGCCLHVVLDDENIDDKYVIHCLDYAIEVGHKDCEELARGLMTMTKTQRLKLGNMVER